MQPLDIFLQGRDFLLLGLHVFAQNVLDVHELFGLSCLLLYRKLCLFQIPLELLWPVSESMVISPSLKLTNCLSFSRVCSSFKDATSASLAIRSTFIDCNFIVLASISPSNIRCFS